MAASSIAIQGIEIFQSSNSPALVEWAIGSLAVLVGAVLLLGFLTPITGAAAAIFNLLHGISMLLRTGVNASALCSFYFAVMSIALVLLGPGAISLDARLFGRREIIIPEARRPPRH